MLVPDYFTLISMRPSAAEYAIKRICGRWKEETWYLKGSS